MATPFVVAPGAESDEASAVDESGNEEIPVPEGIATPVAGALAELAGGWLEAVAIGPGNDDHGNDQTR